MQASRFLPSAIQTLTLTIIARGGRGPAWAECPQPSDGDGKPAFRTEKVKRDARKAAVYATGTVEPEEVIDIGAQVAGAILKFGPADPAKPDGPVVDYCTPAKKGQVLAEIDPRLCKIQLTKAEAVLKAAEAGVELAKADLEEAKTNLDHCTITAPADGVVIDCPAGRVENPGKPCCRPGWRRRLVRPACCRA